MGNEAVAEELAGLDELEALYELNASESDETRTNTTTTTRTTKTKKRTKKTRTNNRHDRARAESGVLPPHALACSRLTTETGFGP